LLFAAMVLLAAAVSMRPPRSGGALSLFAAGILVGFVIFFMSSFLQALGASHQLPIFLAAWAPALISMLLGLSVMMNLEDG
jgi:lipopolysaccharide export system permease protein